MPSEETPVRLNDSGFWRNWQRASIRASNSFRATHQSQSILFTDAELSDMLISLPISRQTRPFVPPTCSGTSHTILPLRTSRSIERETLKREIDEMEHDIEHVNNDIEHVNNERKQMIDVVKNQRDTAIRQRNQLMKLNAGLAKYIATNTN